MDWITGKTSEFLNSSAVVLDTVVQVGVRLESNLSPSASKLIRGVLGNDMLSAGFLFMILRVLYGIFWDGIHQAYNNLISWFYVSVRVQEGDDCYKWLHEWVADRPLTTSIRHLTVKAAWEDDSDDDNYRYNNYADTKDSRPKLVFMPGLGMHALYHKGHKINVSREEPEAVGGDSDQSRILASLQKKQSLTISTFGWDLQFLKDIVKDAMEESYKKKEGKTVIYTTQPYDTYWSGSSTRVPRAFHSVILAKGLKEDLLEDISIFRSSSQWYQERGVPYRRGYLLHGPPGTGKTSFIIALAGHLGMSVCIVNLAASGLNDQQLDQLLNNAPRNSILLMEDVDAALIKRQPGQSQSGSNNVTLSGVLNALDGISAQEGSVLFMTTNHIRKLAPALIRPGRCDRKLLFDYADEDQIRGMFLKFFLTRSTSGITSQERSAGAVGRKDAKSVAAIKAAEELAQKQGSDEKLAAKNAAHDAMIYEIADKLKDFISYKDNVTTAQLQGFFMLNRENAANILDQIPVFLEELRVEKAELEEKKLKLRQKREKRSAKKEKEKLKKKEERKAANGGVSEDEEEEEEENDPTAEAEEDYMLLSDSDSEDDSPTVKAATIRGAKKAVVNGVSKTKAVNGTADTDASSKEKDVASIESTVSNDTVAVVA